MVRIFPEPFFLLMKAIQRISEAIRALTYGATLFGLAGTLQIAQVSSFVLRPFSESLLVRINSHLVGIVWRTMQYIFEQRKKGRVRFSGDRIPNNESALVISNHLSWTDFYLLHSVAMRRKMLHNCKYFVKDSIKWLPFFGWGMWLAGFVFIRRNWLQDRRKIESTFESITRLRTPAWIINYVEGSRITPAKLRESQEFSRQRGYEITNNVLLPRTKGFVACVNEFRHSHIKFVYDFTIAYRHHCSDKSSRIDEPPSIIRVHTRSLEPEYEFHVNVKRFAIEDLPTDSDALGEWLRKRYVEKDRFLAKLRENWETDLGEETWEEPL